MTTWVSSREHLWWWHPTSPWAAFNNVQPYIYWSCQAPTIQSPCQPLTNGPATGFEWCFSFGNGFLGTDVFGDDYYVTAYFVGPAATTTGPEIAEVANAEGESPIIAPNTWVEIKGVNLAPSGDSRTWQGSDFTGNQMPTALDGVSVTVNGKSAYVSYISPVQVNILTPPDAMSGPVQVVLARERRRCGYFHGTGAGCCRHRSSISVEGRMLWRPSRWDIGGSGESLSGRDDTCQAWRGYRDLCERIWADIDACSQRVFVAIRNFIDPASHYYRKHQGNGAVCGVNLGRPFSIQRCRSGAYARWGPDGHSDLRRGVHAGWYVDHSSILSN